MEVKDLIPISQAIMAKLCTLLELLIRIVALQLIPAQPLSITMLMVALLPRVVIQFL
jgi:hypothetical protein